MKWERNAFPVCKYSLIEELDIVTEPQKQPIAVSDNPCNYTGYTWSELFVTLGFSQKIICSD